MHEVRGGAGKLAAAIDRTWRDAKLFEGFDALLKSLRAGEPGEPKSPNKGQPAPGNLEKETTTRGSTSGNGISERRGTRPIRRGRRLLLGYGKEHCRRGHLPLQAEICPGGGGTRQRTSRAGAYRCRVRVASLAKAHRYKDTKVALVLADVAKAPAGHNVA